MKSMTLSGWLWLVLICCERKVIEEERIMTCIPPNPRSVGYIDPTHGPLDGPLYMGSIYSNTPRSLNYRRSGVQDWTTRKLTPPAV